jgi:hypothetical protein
VETRSRKKGSKHVHTNLNRKEGNAMREKPNAILLLIVPVLLSCGAGCADSGGLAISGKAGTLGLGGELTTGITSNVNARVGLNTLDFDYDDEFDDVEYDVGLDFSSFSALVDWHLFDSSFRISGGLISMDHTLDLDATPSGNVSIGDNDYTPAEIGTLSGDVDIDGVAPYIGIGWGDPMDRNKRWGFYCDFGVAFTDSPDVELSATGTAAGLAADLARERDEIKDDLEPFQLYPVISLGLYFRF